MAAYGFRLYRVDLVRGIRGRTGLDLSATGQDGKTHTRVLVSTMLSVLEAHETLTGVPRIQVAQGESHLPISDYATDVVQRDDPQIRWLGHEVRTDRISFEVQFGRVGQYAMAMAPKKADDADIANKAPSHRYRGELWLPDTGTVGILALEAVDTSNVGDIINTWLARAAIELSNDAAAKIAAAKSAKDAEKIDARVYRLRFNQLADWTRMKRLLKRDNTAEIRLTKGEVSQSGRSIRSEVVLTRKITKKGIRQKAINWAENLYARQTDEENPLKKKERKAAVAELEALVPGNVSGVGFNDGTVTVMDDGRKKKIGPNFVDRYFVYPVTKDTRPAYKTWMAEVAKEVVELQSLVGTDLKFET